tara:strand:- start:352 stop:1347 length:996 start_codon:yes stop_codon:yes gene_type:complete
MSGLTFNQVKSDYESGMSAIQIASKYGADHALVHSMLIGGGLVQPTSPTHKRKYYYRRKKIKLPVKQIKSDYESGVSVDELADQHKVSTATIRHRLKNSTTIRNRFLPVLKIWFELEAGASMAEIAQKYGVSLTILKNDLRRAGYEDTPTLKTPRNRKTTLEVAPLSRTPHHSVSRAPHHSDSLDTNQIVIDYEVGMSTNLLAKKYNVNSETIRNRLRGAGVQLRGNSEGLKLELPVAQIISEYKAGMSQIGLSKKFGVDVKTIKRRLEEAGVQTRNRKRKPQPQAQPSVAELPVAQIWFEYESGTTLKALSDKYGASQATIFRMIQGIDQ